MYKKNTFDRNNRKMAEKAAALKELILKGEIDHNEVSYDRVVEKFYKPTGLA